MKIETSGFCKDGKIKFRNLERFTKEILESGWSEFEITVKKKSKHRSVNQNRWYWQCVTILSNELGYTKDEMHEIIKFKLLKDFKIDLTTGETFEYLKSTTDLTTTEFSTFVENLIIWSATQFNCVLPMPNEQLELLPHQK